MTDWADVIDHTWPAAATHRCGGFDIRTGRGGGNRVSAATGTAAAATPDDVRQAVDVMRALGQDPLFMILPRNTALDSLLADMGHQARDETIVRACPVDWLTTEPVPPVTAFTVWPPLAAQRDIWAKGGIGPARLAIMDRVMVQKTTILGRTDDRPAATLFVAIHGQTAMLHALEVAPDYRRKGLARHLTRAAAYWAQSRGATQFSLLVTAANEGANALYEGLGLAEVSRYHYRVLPKETP